MLIITFGYNVWTDNIVTTTTGRRRLIVGGNVLFLSYLHIVNDNLAGGESHWILYFVILSIKPANRMITTQCACLEQIIINITIIIIRSTIVCGGLSVCVSTL